MLNPGKQDSSFSPPASRLCLAAVTLSALVFVVLIPALEVNDTHLFNPAWPSHARLHEAWQLLTNAAVSLLALILVWRNQAVPLAVLLALIVCCSFLLAWATAGIYGGSMLHSDGTELAVAGLNLAVLVVLLLTGGLLLGLWRARASKHPEA